MGWENSFAPHNVFLSHGDLPSSLFPVFPLLSFFAASATDTDQISSQHCPDWFLPSLLHQSWLLLIPLLCYLFGPKPSIVLLSLLILELGTQDLCYLATSYSLHIISMYFSPLIHTRLFQVHLISSLSFMFFICYSVSWGCPSLPPTFLVFTFPPKPLSTKPLNSWMSLELLPSVSALDPSADWFLSHGS